MKHKHKAQSERTLPFQGPVASPENPAAHGNVCHVETCKCGATRRTNVNGRHLERGSWF